MHDKNTIFACNKHIEIAIDDFVDKYEEAPDMLIESNTKCNYCEELAIFRITRFK